MIEPTDEMVRAYFDGATRQAGKVAKARRPAELEGTINRAGLAAVLAIVERDVLQPAVDRAEYAGHERGWRERGERDMRAAAARKEWLIEHVDHHASAPVEGCTFCVAVTP